MALSLQLAHRLQNKHVLLVGGGEVSLTRVEKLVITGCKVTLIAPEIHEDIIVKYGFFAKNSDSNDITNPNWDDNNKAEIYRVIKTEFHDKYFELYKDESLTVNDSSWSIILTCIPNKEVSEHIYLEAKKRFGNQQLVNVADNPPYCDFYFGANLNFPESTNHNQSLIQLLISSNGASPRFTALLRDELDRFLSNFEIEESVKRLGELRSKIRTKSNEYTNNSDEDKTVLKYRMQWIKKCTDIFGLQNCSKIDIDKLLQLYDTMYKNDRSLTFQPHEDMLRDYII